MYGIIKRSNIGKKLPNFTGLDMFRSKVYPFERMMVDDMFEIPSSEAKDCKKAVREFSRWCEPKCTFMVFPYGYNRDNVRTYRVVRAR